MHLPWTAIKNDLVKMAATHQPRVCNQRTAGRIDLTEFEAVISPLSHAQRAVETSCNQNNTAHLVSPDPQTLIADAELQSLAQARQITHQTNSNKVVPAAAEHRLAQTKSCLV
jgi:hypothetical protein